MYVRWPLTLVLIPGVDATVRPGRVPHHGACGPLSTKVQVSAAGTFTYPVQV